MMGKENGARKIILNMIGKEKTQKKYVSKQAAEAGGPWNRQWGQEQTWFNSSDAAEADDDGL